MTGLVNECQEERENKNRNRAGFNHILQKTQKIWVQKGNKKKNRYQESFLGGDFKKAQMFRYLVLLKGMEETERERGVYLEKFCEKDKKQHIEQGARRREGRRES